MISKITKKEFKRLEDLQRNKFHTCLLFTLPDGTPYMCNTMGAAGLKEILRFRQAKKKLERDQLDLLESRSMLLS